MNNKKHLIVQLYTACIMTFVGAFLLIMSFFTEPKGQIEYSVITATAEVITFAGALFGIDYTYKTKNRGGEQNFE